MNHTATQRLFELMNHLDGAYSPNTLRAYRADMLEFIRYCGKTHEAAWPAAPATVAGFLLQTLNQRIKSATIRRKASSISAIHRLSSELDPTKHADVKIALRKIVRHLGSRHDQPYPINRSVLDKLLAVCGSDLQGLRNRALLLLAYDSMRRRSELVALRVGDIASLPSGAATVLLRKSKTDQQGFGKWLHLSRETADALQQWIKAANITEGFILRGIRPNGQLTMSLCESRISRTFKRLAQRATLDERAVNHISGHSEMRRLHAAIVSLGGSDAWPA